MKNTGEKKIPQSFEHILNLIRIDSSYSFSINNTNYINKNTILICKPSYRKKKKKRILKT